MGTDLLPEGTAGDLVTLSLVISEDAAGGAVPINLRASSGFTFTAAFDYDLNELLLEPAPTNGDTDAVDGLLTVDVTDVNEPPRLVNPMSDQVAFTRTEFRYAIPATTFIDPDAGDLLTFTATLDDKSPLPSWLTFDPDSRVFSGEPTIAERGELVVKVTVFDSSVPPLEASTVFRIAVAPWTNLENPMDISGNGDATPADLLQMINRLNSLGPGPLPAALPNGPPPPYFDPNGDGDCTAEDLLLAISYLNERVGAAAGEEHSDGSKLLSVMESVDEEILNLLAEEYTGLLE
jgi:hypothetical protein